MAARSAVRHDACMKICRDCRLRGDSVHHFMLGVARMHSLALAG